MTEIEILKKELKELRIELCTIREILKHNNILNDEEFVEIFGAIDRKEGKEKLEEIKKKYEKKTK
ncbi:hypothetical protein JMUB5056_1720 [Leptotrichia hongkongensis]|uniref:Uncharacterized protein n=1 Tax=Leptotrichia hongkongensis TaxID=554406 RepID=A0A510L8M7_9FUSO|nr:hypothetical protein [Leptotrichia hongkongensis]BBM60126.1 hypothetical protein JMUB5056_1720 [Leptotrichia hongkongensis]